LEIWISSKESQLTAWQQERRNYEKEMEIISSTYAITAEEENLKINALLTVPFKKPVRDISRQPVFATKPSPRFSPDHRLASGNLCLSWRYRVTP